MDKFFTTLLDTLKKRPDMILMICIVFGFLYYMHTETVERRLEFKDQAVAREKAQDARDAKDNRLTEMRITSCHDIQERGIEAMKAVADALLKQAESDAELRATVTHLVAATNANTGSIDDFRNVISGFSALIQQHVYRVQAYPKGNLE